MPMCDTCGNDYDKTFTVSKDGRDYTFDSFECAAQKLAPQCETCGLRILGHGVEGDNKIFCCDHCARRGGVQGLRDRA